MSLDALAYEVSRRRAALAEAGSRRVAIFLDNGADWVAWDLASLLGGHVAVPVPGFFSAEQVRHLLDSAGVDTLVALQPPLGAEGFAARGAGIWRRRPESVPALPAGTAKITFTSGTTGRPKGVCLDAATQLEVAGSLRRASEALGIRRHLCVLPLATLLENVAGVYAPLLAGAEVDVRPMHEIGLQGASGFDVGRLLAVLRESRPHSLILLPQLLHALVEAAAIGHPVAGDLRFVAVGGGRVSPQLLRRAEAAGLPVFEGYGLSECASVACLNTPAARRIGTVGRPLAHAEVRIAEDGEVLVRGPRMLGYVGEPPAAGEWLATGDLGRLDDGFLTLLGRKKDMFVTAFGRNVSPEWVEAELVLQPPIAQAWVDGEASAENRAVLVPRGPAWTDADIDAAVAAVNARLPDYARVRRWTRAREPFTAATGLATANGRLRRAALAAAYPPAGEAPAFPTDHEVPA